MRGYDEECCVIWLLGSYIGVFVESNGKVLEYFKYYLYCLFFRDMLGLRIFMEFY